MSKRALIISDSHGKNDDVKTVIEQVGHIDMLIHLGDIERGPEYIAGLVDCPVHMISGNNDYNLHLQPEDEFEFEGHSVWITHGHRYFVNRGTEVIEDYARSKGVEIAMFGHTHVPFFKRTPDLILLNPGSLSYPRQDGRKHTFTIMEVDDRGELHFSNGELKSSLRDIYKGFY